jgi:hypothetical protein
MPEWMPKAGLTSREADFSPIHSPYYHYKNMSMKERCRRAV